MRVPCDATAASSRWRPDRAEEEDARHPERVESVDESSGNVGDGQDKVVAYRKSPPAQHMFLERSSERVRVNGKIGQWLRTMFHSESFPLTNSTY